jgi:carbamoyl-phosphate synthase large subunit
VLKRAGIETEVISRIADSDGERHNAIDLIREGRIQLVINTPTPGQAPREDQIAIRREAVLYGIPCITTISGAMVAVMGLEALHKGQLDLKSLQEYHAEISHEHAP